MHVFAFATAAAAQSSQVPSQVRHAGGGSQVAPLRGAISPVQLQESSFNSSSSSRQLSVSKGHHRRTYVRFTVIGFVYLRTIFSKVPLLSSSLPVGKRKKGLPSALLDEHEGRRELLLTHTRAAALKADPTPRSFCCC